MSSFSWKALLFGLLVAPVAHAGDGVAEVVVVRDALPPGPSDSPKKPDMRLSLDEYSLHTLDFNFPSGLRVLMQPDHTEPLVGVTMWVDRGSNSDPEGREGIAHYIEHLWFKSKHGEGIPMVWDLLTELGCYLNASTSNDWTNYMTVCPSEHLPILLKLESLRIGETLVGVTEEEMLTEREVVRNELRMRMEIGGGEMIRYLMADVYPPGHPYHRETIGTHDSLSAITLTDIIKFADDHYRPETSTIVVVGDFDPDEASSLIFKSFDKKDLDPTLTDDDFFLYPRQGVESPDRDNPEHWLAGYWDPRARGEKLLDIYGKPKERLSGMALEPPKPRQKVTHHEAPIRRPVVTIGWAVPAGYRGKDTVMSITANTIGSAMYWRFQDPAKERGLEGDRRIYTDPPTGQKAVSCGYWANLINSTVLCVIELANEDVDAQRVAEEALDQVAMAWNPEDPEFERFFHRAKMEYMRDLLFSVDIVADLYGRATSLAEYAHYTGKGTYVSDAMTQATEGSLHEARELAFKWLQRDRAAISILKPIPEEDLILDSSDSAYHGASRDSDTVKGSAIDLKTIDAKFLIEATKVPSMGDMIDTRLPNGLRIVAMRHGPVPIAQAVLAFEGGNSSLEDGEIYFAGYFSRIDDLAYTDKDPLQIAGEFQWLTGASETTMAIESSSANLGGALWILREQLDSLRPYTAGKADWVKRRKSSTMRPWKGEGDPSWFADWQVSEQLFAGHPTLRETMPDIYDTMKGWGAGDVKLTLNKLYQPANATLVIVGAIDPKAAVEQATAYFGGWRAKPGTPIQRWGKIPGPVPAKPARVLVFDDPLKPQTDVQLTCQVQPWTDENRLSIDLAADLLDDLSWRILREDAGATYGAGSGFRANQGGSGELVVSSLVQNDATGLAVSTFQRLVREVEAGEIDNDRLTVLKLSRARKFGLGHQSVDDMVTRLLGYRRGVGDWSHLKGYGERVAAVDIASIQAATKGCADNAIVTLTGPVEIITPKLDEAGVTYEVFDWKASADELLEKYDPKGFKKTLKDRAKKAAKEAAGG